MAHALFDRVLETSTTTGTGSFTVAGAVTGFKTFASRYSTNDTFPYFIEGVDANGVPTGEWESGIGTYSAANTVARTTVLASSNADAAVTFSAGTKRVGVGALAKAGVFAPVLIETLSTTSGTSVTSAALPQRFNQLLVQTNGVSHDSGTSQTLAMSFSNNGTDFTGTVSAGNSFAATGTWYGGVMIPRYTADSGLYMLACFSQTADLTITTGSNPTGGAWRVAGGIKYIKFAPSAGNFDAGSIDIFGL